MTAAHLLIIPIRHSVKFWKLLQDTRAVDGVCILDFFFRSWSLFGWYGGCWLIRSLSSRVVPPVMRFRCHQWPYNIVLSLMFCKLVCGETCMRLCCLERLSEISLPSTWLMSTLCILQRWMFALWLVQAWRLPCCTANHSWNKKRPCYIESRHPLSVLK